MYNYKKGDMVKGKVTGIEKYGIFVSINDGVTGLIHISEISDAFVKNVFDYVEMDEIINCKVIEYDEVNNKLKLSIKNINYRNNQNKRKGIIETKGGFTKLGEELNNWIDFKLSEIEEKNQKK